MNLTLSGPPQKSQVPAANGLYRVTAPFEGLGRGKECTANTAATDKSTPIKECPGYVGEIDGKLGCYGTAQKPVTTVDKPIPGGAAPIAGNPPAGTPSSSADRQRVRAGRRARGLVATMAGLLQQLPVVRVVALVALPPAPVRP